MRRPDREIVDADELADVLHAARTVYLGIGDDPAPYVVPLFYGYEDETIYIHCAREGLKLDLIHKNPRVGFSLAEEPRIMAGESACSFSACSRSIVGHGTARIVENETERTRGLSAIMRHYGSDERTYASESLSRTCVLAVDVELLRGKRIG
jgi:nitroimidazol reductase NimA-like FMN-containing flavoprotein (pyridoxamine 5'-phosphate oxidase superfamily)